MKAAPMTSGSQSPEPALVHTTRGWKVRIKWEPRDCWIGLYWTHRVEFIGQPRRATRQWFICIVPCLPIVITRWERLWWGRATADVQPVNGGGS